MCLKHNVASTGPHAPIPSPLCRQDYCLRIASRLLNELDSIDVVEAEQMVYKLSQALADGGADAPNADSGALPREGSAVAAAP